MFFSFSTVIEAVLQILSLNSLNGGRTFVAFSRRCFSKLGGNLSRIIISCGSPAAWLMGAGGVETWK